MGCGRCSFGSRIRGPPNWIAAFPFGFPRQKKTPTHWCQVEPYSAPGQMKVGDSPNQGCWCFLGSAGSGALTMTRQKSCSLSGSRERGKRKADARQRDVEPLARDFGARDRVSLQGRLKTSSGDIPRRIPRTRNRALPTHRSRNASWNRHHASPDGAGRSLKAFSCWKTTAWIPVKDVRRFFLRSLKVASGDSKNPPVYLLSIPQAFLPNPMIMSFTLGYQTAGFTSPSLEV